MLLTLFLSVALAQEIPVNTDAPSESFEEFKPDLPALYAMPGARSRFGLPEQYFDAEELDAKAREAHAAGNMEEAAADFLDVATLLLVKKPTTYSEQFSAIRQVAYRNAALAWKAAGNPKAGQAALKAAAGRDADNRMLCEELAASLL